MKLALKCIFILLINSLVFAQTSNKNEQELQAKSEPLELPSFIIQGNLKVDVATGVKQDPKKPNALTSNILDSINSLDKQPSILLVSDEMIPTSLKQTPINAYLGVDIGRFTTGDVYGFYQTNVGGYSLAFKGNYDFGAGHIDKAEFNKLNLGVSSDFIAPMKFFIFGGSRTRTSIEYNNYSYNLYSNLILPSHRSMNHFKATVDVEGNSGGIQFNTGLGFNGFQLKTEPVELADNNFSTYLRMKKRWDKFLIGANAIIDLHSLAGNNANFIQLGGELSFIAGDLSIGGEAAFQIASTPNDIDRGGLLINGNLEYRLNKFFTIKGNVRSGLSKQTFIENYYQNPYISNFSNYDFSYDIINFNGIIEFHPYQELSVSTLFNFAHKDRIPVFIDDSFIQLGTFNLSYQTGTIIKSVFEANWKIESTGNIVANLTAIQSSLSDYSSSSIPYYPNISIGVEYIKQWNHKFGTKIGLDYVGERYVDLINSKKLDAYLNIKLGADYKILDNMKLFVNFENLINSDIYIWNGYKERGIFASIGARYNF
ncbi:MAG TPA: TonB-dependent receptor [Candidatus Kapabacteria bacterium]|nr:TonB-dependent receptor [Candidatus Kapabacteria bacterium]